MGDIFANPPEQLRVFLRDGRIAVMPAKRDRRRMLLEQVAAAFEPGRQYPEAVVDEVLKSVVDDHCTLRRYLVDEDLMSRDTSGVYWRSGGAVHV
jgi:hypothetical protein